MLKRLPAGSHLIFNLASNSNLFRWKILQSSNCNLCLKPQTQLQIFNFIWRHNSILSSLILNKIVCSHFKLFADLTNYENPRNLFVSRTPELVIKESNSINAIELTCPS